MSNDLISRKALLDRFRYREKDSEYDKSWMTTVRRIIKEQPTAFDKEKVIMELEEIGQECNECNDIFGVEAIEYAAEIVEKGGIE